MKLQTWSRKEKSIVCVLVWNSAQLQNEVRFDVCPRLHTSEKLQNYNYSVQIDTTLRESIQKEDKTLK